MTKPRSRVDENPKTLPSTADAELDFAVRVASGHRTSEQEALSMGVRHFGDKFRLFSDSELEHISGLAELILRYVSQRTHPRPLCIAVFGPPGSGKSFAVEQIAEAIEGTEHAGVSSGSGSKMPMTTINLTQVSSASEISAVLARVAGEQKSQSVPILFFDEFDAPRDGAVHGWLPWFLAPMQDGEFLHGGAVVRLQRAIYVFAGGTASTMSEFADRANVAGYQAAKLPDFTSRIRAYLNVSGPNSGPREIRRAFLLASELQKKAARMGVSSLRMPEGVLSSLLRVGRFRHGARSVSAVVDMCRLDQTSETIDWHGLPEDHLIALHIDRGLLDERRVGGAIAISAYPDAASPPPSGASWAGHTHAQALLNVCLGLAKAMWQEGATLAYSGNWHDDPTPELMKALVSALERLPIEPTRNEAKRAAPDPRLRSFLSGREANEEAKLEKLVSRSERTRLGLHVTVSMYLDEPERKKLERQAVRNAVEMFRQRLDVTESSIARVVVGGSTSDHRGRMPGVADEVVLSLARGHPVYVLGGWGGAAAEVGRLLGLGGIRSGEVGDLFAPDDEHFKAVREKFQAPPFSSLPATARDAALFLQSRALGSDAWPNNGLTLAENRELFSDTVYGLRMWLRGYP